MSRAVKIINEIPANKAGITMFAEAIVEGVMSGEADPLDIRKRIDAIEKIIKEIKDNPKFKDAVMDQADLWPEKTFEHDGVKFTKADFSRYDYTSDPVWSSIKKQESHYAGLRKGREKILLALTEPTEIDGVMSFPPNKTSGSYVKVTF
jgi:hypothetical protein